MKRSEQKYWNEYLQSLLERDRPVNPFVTAAYAGTPEITDELLALYLCGKKTAGSSIVEDYVSAGDLLPKVGNYWIYLNSQNVPSCILRTERIETNKFRDVSESIAIAEGEGDLSLAYWKRVHAEIYLPHLKSWGIAHMDDATVITEFFTIVFR